MQRQLATFIHSSRNQAHILLVQIGNYASPTIKSDSYDVNNFIWSRGCDLWNLKEKPLKKKPYNYVLLVNFFKKN
jgi:hypothetical protein